MASFVLSECGIKPFPRIYPKPRRAPVTASSLPLKPNGLGSLSLKLSSGGLRARNWGLSVSAPARVSGVGEEKEEEETAVNGGAEFDPGTPPPFKLADIRAAIPKHCWVKDPWRSMSYVLRDVVVVLGLAAAAAYFNNWVVWPLYWAAQGTMFWALFVLGHDW